jgi:hypothetical protein
MELLRRTTEAKFHVEKSGKKFDAVAGYLCQLISAAMLAPQ